MAKASKVFLIIGLVCSALIIFFGLMFWRVDVISHGVFLFFLIYGIYGCVVTFGGLIALSVRSFPLTVIFAILNLFVVTIASIFMFFIDPGYYIDSVYFKTRAKKNKSSSTENIISLPNEFHTAKLPFDAIMLKSYFGADDNGENISLMRSYKVRVVGHYAPTGTYTLEFKDANGLLHTVRAVPSFYIGIGDVEIKKKEIQLPPAKPEFPCNGILINKYFGNDSCGERIAIEANTNIVILCKNKSDSTYDIEVNQNEKNRTINSVPSFYVQIIKE